MTSPTLTIDGLTELMKNHPDFVRLWSTTDDSGGIAAVDRWKDGALETFTAIFTTEDAKEFLEKSEVWRKFPERMMRIRAIYAAAEKAFPEFFPKKPTIH